jgi:hypothetical protein
MKLPVKVVLKVGKDDGGKGLKVPWVNPGDLTLEVLCWNLAAPELNNCFNFRLYDNYSKHVHKKISHWLINGKMNIW